MFYCFIYDMYSICLFHLTDVPAQRQEPTLGEDDLPPQVTGYFVFTHISLMSVLMFFCIDIKENIQTFIPFKLHFQQNCPIIPQYIC